MKYVRFLVILLAMAACQVCSLRVPCARAQWNMVASRAIRVLGVECTAIRHCDGVVWAGCINLVRSSDSGLTWRQIPQFFDPTLDRITDIQFLDTSVGLVTTYFGAYLTTDGGITWRNKLDNMIDGAASGCFAGGKDTLAVSDFGGEVLISKDAGRNWTAQRIDTNGTQILYRDGTLYVLNAIATTDPGAGGRIRMSSDRGSTWQKMPNEFDADSYSMVFDSCQGDLFVTNETFAIADTLSRVISTADGGLNWRSTIAGAPRYFEGSIESGSKCVFTSSDGGVYRGYNGAWVTIGGPRSGIDMRSVCAINDELLLVIDQGGSIWRTTNSGGVPLPYTLPAIAPTKLFVGRHLAPCEAAREVLIFTPDSGIVCRPTTQLPVRVTGPDSMYYVIVHAVSGPALLDSIVALFLPDSDRDYHATLDIPLSDGITFHVPLGGHGADSANVTLLASNFTRDTIGQGAIVPVTALGVSAPAYDLDISWDTAVLVYKGTFDAMGNKLDVGLPTKAHAVIHMPGASGALSTDTARFYSHFEFYPTALDAASDASGACGTVTFGPGRFNPDTALCGTIRTATVQVCAPYSCGESYLSRLMRLGEGPVFRIVPNPATTQIEITSSLPVPDATIEVLNALGRVELRQTTDLGRDAFVTYLTGLTSGPKFVRITTGSGAQVLPLLIL